MSPEEASQICLEDLIHSGRAPRTIKGARVILDRFTDYCRVHTIQDLRQVTVKNLLGYQRWLSSYKTSEGKPLSLIYQNMHIRRARSLFKMLYDRQYILNDPGRDLPSLHDPMPLPRGILSKEQMMKLLSQPPLTTPLGYRDRAILELLYSTGIRGAELAHLTLYDLELDARTLRVLKGKGGKDRVVPIGRIAASYLTEYIKTVRPLFLGQTQSPHVFLGIKHQPMTTYTVRNIIRKYRQRAGLPDGISTHSIRHTCATEMLKGGASIRHVQELLGHASITTTQMYTRVIVSDLKKAHKKTAPSEQRTTLEHISFHPKTAKWKDEKNAVARKRMNEDKHGRKRSKKVK